MKGGQIWGVKPIRLGCLNRSTQRYLSVEIKEVTAKVIKNKCIIEVQALLTINVFMLWHYIFSYNWVFP
jgi:hypothetical protein